MRWGSLFSTLILAGGAAAAPGILSNSAGLDDKGLDQILATVKAYHSGEGLDLKGDRQWQALQDGQLEEVSLERLAALQDLAGRQTAGAGQDQDVAAALIEAFKKQKPLSEEWGGQVLRDSERLRRFYQGARPKAVAFIALGLVSTFAVAVLGALPLGRGLARFVLGMVFGLNGRWLMFLSLAVPAYAGASGLNVWPLLPRELLFAPIGFMLLSGAFLWLLDPNYPLWNMLVRSLGSPMLSCLATFGWVRLKPAV